MNVTHDIRTFTRISTSEQCSLSSGSLKTINKANKVNKDHNKLMKTLSCTANKKIQVNDLL